MTRQIGPVSVGPSVGEGERDVSLTCGEGEDAVELVMNLDTMRELAMAMLEVCDEVDLANEAN
jgi:hypothetical protein